MELFVSNQGLELVLYTQVTFETIEVVNVVLFAQKHGVAFALSPAALDVGGNVNKAKGTQPRIAKKLTVEFEIIQCSLFY